MSHLGLRSFRGPYLCIKCFGIVDVSINDLRVQTYDLSSLTTLLAMLDVTGHPTDQEIGTCTL